MSEDAPLKVLVIGPSRSGKSTLADFLSDHREAPTSKYYETDPLRILETEVDLETTKVKKNTNVFGADNTRVKRVTVRLWDLSGNAKHQACWPAVASGCDGIIFVFNPEVERGERELLLWHKQFFHDPSSVDDEGKLVRRVRESCCLVLGHHSSPPSGAGDAAVDSATAIRNRVAALKGFEQIRAVESSLDYQSENFKDAFDRLIESVMTCKAEDEEEEVLRRQREEVDRPQVRP